MVTRTPNSELCGWRLWNLKFLKYFEKSVSERKKNFKDFFAVIYKQYRIEQGLD